MAELTHVVILGAGFAGSRQGGSASLRTLAQVGRGAAVVELPTGGMMTGHLAWLAWLGVHLSLLKGAEEKCGIFVDWGWNILTHKRGKCIILSDEDVASAQ